MPDQGINKAVIAAALGVSLFGGTTLFAEHRDDLQTRDMTDTERTHLRSPDVSGGFYDDGDTIDNWYYDFYDSRADRPEARLTDRPRFRNPNDTFLAERDRMSDAAHPVDSRLESDRRLAADSAYRRYYDDPWFYDQRDQAFGMPMTSSWNDAFRTPGRDEEFVRGTVSATKFVRNTRTGGQNAVALVRMNDGRQVIADLGPSQKTLDFALTQGDNIQVWGQKESIGPYSVLMARDIKSGVNRVKLERESGANETDYRLISGRIEQFRDIKLRQNGELHRTAALRTDDGRLAIVDIGPTPAENVPANAAPRDRMTASGPVVQVGNYPVLLADRLSINNGIPVQVVRSDAEYVDPSRRPFEASQQESATDPSCVGGGCEAGTVNRATPRNPLSNAMDGDIGSERR